MAKAVQEKVSEAFLQLPPFLQEHSRRVGSLSRLFAQYLIQTDRLPKGVLAQAVLPEAMETMGLYHDIGKSAIYAPVWTSMRALTHTERKLVDIHPLMGEYLVRGRLLPPEAEEGSSLQEKLAWCCKYHHERWDGTGYPFGLAGKKIPVQARMIALADSYDAMTELRPYHKGISKKDALDEILRCAGAQFDPELAVLFAEFLEVFLPLDGGGESGGEQD